MSKELSRWRGTTFIPTSSDLRCFCLTKEGVEFELTVPFEYRDTPRKWFKLCVDLNIKKWRYKK